MYKPQQIIAIITSGIIRCWIWFFRRPINSKDSLIEQQQQKMQRKDVVVFLLVSSLPVIFSSDYCFQVVLLQPT